MCVYNNIYVHTHIYIYTYITNVPASRNNKNICFSSQKTEFHGLMILPNIRKEMEVS